MSFGRSYGEARACFPHLPRRPPGASGRHLLRFAFRPVEVGCPVSNKLSTPEGNS